MRDQKPHTPPPARRGDDAIPMNGAGFGAGIQHAKPGTAMVKLESGPVTAIQVAVPRSLKEIQVRVLEEVELMGDSFFYSWTVNDKDSPTGKSLIQGMSVEGAKVLYRNWGNVNYDVQIVDETATHWTFHGILIDWEAGATYPRLFRQRKSQRAGDNMNGERQQDMAIQIGQSKLFRNVIAMAMPRWLIDKAMALAANAEINRYAENLPKAIFDMLLAARNHGVTKEELWRKAGKEFKIWQDEKTKKWHVEPEAWSPVDVAQMMAILRAIDDQQTTVDIEFRGVKAPTQESDAPAAQEPPTPATPPAPAAGSEGFDNAVSAEPAAAPTPATPPPTATATPTVQAPAATPAPAQTERRSRRQREPGED